ncbi:MAG TPA: hypothetical protein VNW90_05480 [Acetobacteraceae bacterium]|jgi:hypothetical protein|nr:hypothetical protein [Acetobacteraceae bacterium]
MNVEDPRPRGLAWTVRLQEKGGKQHAMPCHHGPLAGHDQRHHPAGMFVVTEVAARPPNRYALAG